MSIQKSYDLIHEKFGRDLSRYVIIPMLDTPDDQTINKMKKVIDQLKYYQEELEHCKNKRYWAKEKSFNYYFKQMMGHIHPSHELRQIKCEIYRHENRQQQECFTYEVLPELHNYNKCEIKLTLLNIMDDEEPEPSVRNTLSLLYTDKEISKKSTRTTLKENIRQEITKLLRR